MQPQLSWENIRRELDTACAESSRVARAQLAHEFNQLQRRFRQYETEAEWADILLDAASRFAKQVAAFALANGIVSLRGQANLSLDANFSFALKSAAAFSSAADSKDPVTALRTAWRSWRGAQHVGYAGPRADLSHPEWDAYRCAVVCSRR